MVKQWLHSQCSQLGFLVDCIKLRIRANFNHLFSHPACVVPCVLGLRRPFYISYNSEILIYLQILHWIDWMLNKTQTCCQRHTSEIASEIIWRHKRSANSFRYTIFRFNVPSIPLLDNLLLIWNQNNTSNLKLQSSIRDITTL